MKALLRRIRKRLEIRRLLRHLGPMDDVEHNYVMQLRQDLSAKARPSDGQVQQWVGNELAVRDHILSEKDPRAFLRWDVIASSMVFQDEAHAQRELATLSSSDEWTARWSEALEESAIGCPKPLEGELVTSGNLVHHTFHAYSFERVTGRRLNEFSSIFELGGGYGSFCRLTHRLGFEGDYVIYDLPALLALQRFYLQMLAHNGGMPSSAFDHVTQTNELGEVRPLMKDPALFVATWSLSEIAADQRAEIARIVEPCSAQLLAYQETFSGLDNTTEFDEWERRFPDLQWHREPIEGLPGNFYLFGWKP